MDDPVAFIDVTNRTLEWAKPTRWETPTIVNIPFVPLYTVPPKKEWVGLTTEEIIEITGVKSTDSDWNVVIVHKWIRAIEAKLKEKNIF